MKILEVTFYLASGGAERLLVDLSNELSQNHEVVLLTLKDDTVEPEKRQFYKSELSDRVLYKNLGLGKGYSLKMLWKVYKAIKRERADVVHLHVHGVPYYCVLPIYLLRGKPKFYQTIHSDLNNGYTNLFYKILIRTAGNWKKMGFVALSDTNYKQFKSVYPKAKAACIVNGRAPVTPTRNYKDVKKEMASYKCSPGARIFLHVARCAQVKNQKMLVKAFGEALKAGVDADLVVVGDGYDSELGKQVREIACERIHFIGPRKNISDYMLSSDLFCLSSTFEGMPITMLEASLAGLPIVSTPVCGALDLITSGINGIISKDYTQEQYAKALLEAQERLEELRQHSQIMMENSLYTIKVCADKYVEFFNQ